jgi:hypothetical protein
LATATSTALRNERVRPYINGAAKYIAEMADAANFMVVSAQPG